MQCLTRQYVCLRRETAHRQFHCCPQAQALAVEQVTDRNQRGITIVVAHGTVIALIVTNHAGTELFASWQRLGRPSSVALHVPCHQLKSIRAEFAVSLRGDVTTASC
jgi:hypothetical protein